MSEDPIDFFDKFFQEIVRMSQRINTQTLPSSTALPPESHFIRDGREVFPYDDKWVLVENLGTSVKEENVEVKLIEDKKGRYVTVVDIITNTSRKYKLAKNMTGKFKWSVRNGYLQLDLYINEGE